jgi:hypothetical protein
VLYQNPEDDHVAAFQKIQIAQVAVRCFFKWHRDKLMYRKSKQNPLSMNAACLPPSTKDCTRSTHVLLSSITMEKDFKTNWKLNMALLPILSSTHKKPLCSEYVFFAASSAELQRLGSLKMLLP